MTGKGGSGTTSDPIDRASAVLEVDLTGVAANWRLLAALVAPAECAAVVKADAYGLGASQVSAALAAAGCRLFFAATLDEAIALRNRLPTSCEIAVLNGPLRGSTGEFVFHRLIPVLNVPVEIKGDEIIIHQGDRRYRVRGLAKNMSYELLRVNLLVSGTNTRGESVFHVDTFDLYSARQRSNCCAIRACWTASSPILNIAAWWVRKPTSW